MSKCENCIHYDACEDWANIDNLNKLGFPFECEGDKKPCAFYKDKSLFVELPCEVGDTVYMPWKYNGQEGIACLKVTSMEDVIGLGLDFGTNLDTDDDGYYEACNCGRFKIEDVGKTVFLTKEEAEAKLKEMG